MRACMIVGDETSLAQRLHVPVHFLVNWLLGDERVPTEIFLRAADIVIGANRIQVQDNRALLEQIRKRHRHPKASI